MYYLYLFMSFLKVDRFFPGAGVSSLEGAMSMFTKAKHKANIAVSQFKSAKTRTEDQIDNLRIQFHKNENELNQAKALLDNNVDKSVKYLEKIESFLKD